MCIRKPSLSFMQEGHLYHHQGALADSAKRFLAWEEQTRVKNLRAAYEAAKQASVAQAQHSSAQHSTAWSMDAPPSYGRAAAARWACRSARRSPTKR